MGIKGTVRRNQDGHFIHANIDLDIIITEEVRVLTKTVSTYTCQLSEALHCELVGFRW